MYKALEDYRGRCGGCVHYIPQVKDNGKEVRFGHCEIANKYKQACGIACKKNYKEMVKE